MPGQMNDQSPSSNGWLKSYYYLRFAVSAAWVVAAFTRAKSIPPLAVAMLFAYSAWDALADYIRPRLTCGRRRKQC